MIVIVINEFSRHTVGWSYGVIYVGVGETQWVTFSPQPHVGPHVEIRDGVRQMEIDQNEKQIEKKSNLVNKTVDLNFEFLKD